MSAACCTAVGSQTPSDLEQRRSSGVLSYDPYETFKFLLVGDTGSGKTSLLTRYRTDTFDDCVEPTEGVDFEVVYLSLPQLFKQPGDDVEEMSYSEVHGADDDGVRLLSAAQTGVSSEDEDSDDGLGASTLAVGSRHFVKLHISDISGDPKYSSILKSYSGTTNVNGIVIVFNVCSRDSFDIAVGTLLKEVQELWLGTYLTSSDFLYAADGRRSASSGSRSRLPVLKPTVTLVGNFADDVLKREVSFAEANKAAKANSISYIETSSKTGANVSRVFNSVVQDLIWRRHQKSVNPSEIRSATKRELRVLKKYKQVLAAEEAVAGTGDCGCHAQACAIL